VCIMYLYEESTSTVDLSVVMLRLTGDCILHLQSRKTGLQKAPLFTYFADQEFL
jgi:hypothetical protein